jgi:hypothetical protein
MANHANSSFEQLGAFLWERLSTPVGHVSFWTYFVLAIVIFGAAGIWVEAYRFFIAPQPEPSGILTAIYTYFPAVAAGATLQLVMASQDKHVRSFSMFAAVVIGIAAVPHALGLVAKTASFSWGLFGTAAALLLWWIANGANQDFLDSAPVDSLGGDVTGEPSGDVGDFNV